MFFFGQVGKATDFYPPNGGDLVRECGDPGYFREIDRLVKYHFVWPDLSLLQDLGGGNCNFFFWKFHPVFFVGKMIPNLTCAYF